METRSFGEIAGDLELAGNDAATRLVRSAVERLRAHFAPKKKTTRARRKFLTDRSKKASRGK